MKKLLIFGASGKLGSEIVSQVPKNIEVEAPTHTECDITDMQSVKAVITKFKPNVVLNAAALVGAKECEDNKILAWNINVIGASNIAKVCFAEQIRLVHISSAAIFAGTKGNYSEEDVPDPTFYYAITKVAAEQAILMLDNYAIVRLDFFTKTRLKYYKVFADHYTSKIPVSEAAEKVIQIIQSNFTGVINIGQEGKSLYDILKPYFPEIEAISIQNSALPNFPKDISLNLTKWKTFFE